ncbi:thioredoxin family protein [Geomonas edaphica]|uniref:thioredoxin family protein n=1 Tax=Geomonas edaphica TaxID=2570226 RepID=UPI001FECB66E|nr:thioredoxin family protein [Geomonas edaphica]
MAATMPTSTPVSVRPLTRRGLPYPLGNIPPLPSRALTLSFALLLLVFLTCRFAWAAPEATLYYFWGVGCPHCEQAKPFLEELKRKYPDLKVEATEVLQHRENIPRLMLMAKERGREATGVPVFILGPHYLSGFSEQTRAQLENAVREALPPAGGASSKAPPAAAPQPPVAVPGLGELDPQRYSLPVFTLVIAALDSFNPCAFFVLFFLLSLLIHARSRRRMLLIGGVFVVASGVLYFLFLAAWLNLFLIVGSLPAITAVAGLLALFIALVNIKDFFLFHKGISLSIPEDKKPRLFARMRRLLKAESLPSLLVGSTVLAVAANSYELLCTAGFPMVFTRALTLHEMGKIAYYGYLALYCAVYIVPLAVIVVIFTVTLGGRKLSEWQGRVLKLVSGVMMLGLGVVLLIRPALLNDPATSLLLLLATLALAGGGAWMFREAGGEDREERD